MDARFVQANIAHSACRGTVRGMHYQLPPHAEGKLIRCTKGAIFNAIIDLRPSSATYLTWFGTVLLDTEHRMLYVPEGCANGYQSLMDGAEVFYLTSAAYAPLAERGLRFDDARFAIRWPLPVSVISGKDAGWPPFAEDEYEAALRHGAGSSYTSTGTGDDHR